MSAAPKIEDSPYSPETKRAAVKPFRPLTTRQEEVARLVAQGLSYKKIGHALGINTLTAMVHVRRIAELLPSDDLPAKQRVQIWAVLAGY